MYKVLRVRFAASYYPVESVGFTFGNHLKTTVIQSAEYLCVREVAVFTLGDIEVESAGKCYFGKYTFGEKRCYLYDVTYNRRIFFIDIIS